MFERLIRKLPLINIIYTSLNDLITAFVGEKRKFDKPVMVQLSPESNLIKIGFITKSDMEHIGCSCSRRYEVCGFRRCIEY